MSGKHITILGGTGFVGRSLVAHLANQGHHVKVLSRYRDNGRSLRVLPQVSVVQGNVHNPEFLQRELTGSDAVVNLVAILNEFGGKNEKFERVHVELVESIAKCCEAGKVGKLVHVSALKADAENGPSNYLRTKGKAEGIIKRQGTGSFRWSILQPSVIFGAEDSFVNRFAGLLKLPAPFLPLPRANARFAPVYVEDVVKAIAYCIDNDDTHGCTFQLCGPQVFSLKEIVEKIRAQLNITRPIISMPDPVSRMQAAVMDFVPGKPFSSDNFKSLMVHSICDSDGFAKMGIKPRSMGAIMPRYLGDAIKSRRYGRMRAKAGRKPTK
ncbi:MAG: complex I NDUFA9 subunit family protein [Gammaproteobacteria bacterium]